MPEHSSPPEHHDAHAHTGGHAHAGRVAGARRQWAWIAVAAAVVLALVAVVVLVAVPRSERAAEPTPTRDVVTRKSAADAFPGGLATQPAGVNQPGIHVEQARDDGDTGLADQLSVIADQPIATWLTTTDADRTKRTIDSVLASANAQDRTPTFVLYAVPDRDCGSYSKGGATSSKEYLAWVRSVGKRLDGSGAAVLVEPDAIAQIQVCRKLLDQGRLQLMDRAVGELVGHGLAIYLDGGNENRVPTKQMASWLRKAGIDRVQGFFTNVSNFYRVDTERTYADRLADEIGGDPHFVIDVSRNGQGWRGTWCNPDGAGLGQTPHVTGGTSRLDALLWVKTPGLSDGTCNGGPAAGQWWEQYALALVQNRRR